MKQIASYLRPWRDILDGWVLEWKLPEADLVSKEKNVLSFFSWCTVDYFYAHS